MTNYNENLDKALERLAVAGRGWGVSESAQIESMSSELDEAKQAINSLTKELVADAINSECLALLNDLEEEQAACYSNHHKNSETFVPFVSLDIIQKAKEKYFEIAKRRIEETNQ